MTVAERIADCERRIAELERLAELEQRLAELERKAQAAPVSIPSVWVGLGCIHEYDSLSSHPLRCKKCGQNAPWYGQIWNPPVYPTTTGGANIPAV